MFSVLVTPRNIQNPGLEIRHKGVEVHQSNRVAVHPPWRFPREFAWWGCTWKRNVQEGWDDGRDGEGRVQLVSLM